jgi:hypothetical protein
MSAAYVAGLARPAAVMAPPPTSATATLLAGLLVVIAAGPRQTTGADTKPYLRSVKYQFYAASNAKWGPAEWGQELRAMAAVRVERVTVRNPLDSHWPNYSLPLQLDERRCSQEFTAFFTLGSVLGANPCVRQYSNASEEQQPLTMLIKAAARVNISVILGLAWSGSAPKQASGLVSLARLQRTAADRLWGLYATAAVQGAVPRRAVIAGAYTEVEFNNCHTAEFADAYLAQYLVPVSNHIVSLHKTHGLDPPFIYADPYFEDRSSCLSASEFGEFWRRAFVAAPGFSLIAPQDGVGAHDLPSTTIDKFLGALRNASHAAHRKFGVLVELFQQFPLGTYNQPTCVHRRPAPWLRIKDQLQNEAVFSDGGEFTAWEFHSYLSPMRGPCEWSHDPLTRNGSKSIYQQYKGFVDGLFVGQ